MLTVACVRTGTKYHTDYVHRLRRGVSRYLLDRRHRFVCLTDRPGDLPDLDIVDVSRANLPAWWAKMLLFSTAWRHGGEVLYFDLDTVIAGELDKLAALDVRLGICANFTRAAGHADWPCKYGSCVMKIGAGWGEDIWQAFAMNAQSLMAVCERYGDQMAIEQLVDPSAVTILQEVLPPGFFLGYRDLPKHPAAAPKGCSVVVFAGLKKPHNCTTPWAARAWAA